MAGFARLASRFRPRHSGAPDMQVRDQGTSTNLKFEARAQFSATRNPWARAQAGVPSAKSNAFSNGTRIVLVVGGVLGACGGQASDASLSVLGGI